MRPTISVIVPVYKVEAYLDRCLESIVSQTYENLEIILVDDGSPDNCPFLCDEWAKRDKRIKVIHKANDGLGRARNSGIDIAVGEYIMFVDSDDYISLDAVEVLYERMISDKSDFAIGKHLDTYSDGSTNNGFCSWIKDEVMDKRQVMSHFGVVKYFPVFANGKLYKKSIFDGIRYPKLYCGEDMWLFSDILDKCNTVSVVDKDIYYYYQRDNSIVHNKSEKAKHDTVVATIKLMMYFIKVDEWNSANNWCIRAINETALLSHPKSGIKLFKESLTKKQKTRLFKSIGIKANFKWKLLFIPYSFKIINGLKNICFWRKK